MNNIKFFNILVIVFIAIAFQSAHAQKNNEPWTEKQIIEPAELVKILNNTKAAQPIVYCIGPQALIKNSIYIGSTRDKNNLNKLKQLLEKQPKNANIIIYCGCCPFDRCPNVRPAFNLLNEMKFKNQKLLNLSRNIKVDWIDKGYPVSN